MTRGSVVFVLALATAVSSAYLAGRASMVPAVEQAPAPVSAPSPVLRITPLQQMGHQLMECRELKARARCVALADSGCAAARAAVTGDGIFDAIRGKTHEDEFDVVARVDAAMVTCATETGTFYQQRVWIAGE